MSWATIGQVILWQGRLFYVTGSWPGSRGWRYDAQAVDNGESYVCVPALECRVLPQPDVPPYSPPAPPVPTRPSPPRKKRAR